MKSQKYGQSKAMFYKINYFTLKNILKGWDPGHKCE